MNDRIKPHGERRLAVQFKKLNEQTRFLVVGAFNTGFGYLTFACLYLMLKTWLYYLVIAVLSHALSVIVAFYCHRHLVFRSAAPWFPEFVRYNISLAGVLLGSLAGLYALVSLLGMNPLLGQALVTATAVIVSYFAHRHFSFRRT
jgi:putative flippase GtrA